MIKVKICGITNLEDAKKAVYYGAWAIGFIFHKKSPRYISPSKVRKIIEALPPFITPVGVFVNPGEGAVKEICRVTNIRTLQFHGDESSSFCKRFRNFKVIKAFRVGLDLSLKEVSKYKVDAYLFDTYKDGEYGGTGEAFSWDLIKNVKFERPIILSGGMNSQNVKTALETVSPYAVDVSSGLEKSPGVKDPRLIREFMQLLET